MNPDTSYPDSSIFHFAPFAFSFSPFYMYCHLFKPFELKLETLCPPPRNSYFYVYFIIRTFSLKQECNFQNQKTTLMA